MNNYNNETLPHFKKMVSIKFDEDPKDIDSIIRTIVYTFKAIYGIIFLLFPKEKSFIVLSKNVDDKQISLAKDFLNSPFLEDEIEIIPFPKK